MHGVLFFRVLIIQTFICSTTSIYDHHNKITCLIHSKIISISASIHDASAITILLVYRQV